MKSGWRQVCARPQAVVLGLLVLGWAGWLAGAGASGSLTAERAESLPPGFVSESFIQADLALPTAIAFAPNNAVFIAEKRGVVRVWRQGALLPEPFIDLQDEVGNYRDRGLLGLALHPDFPATPYVYLLYVYDPPGVEKDAGGARVSRLLRVTADARNPDVAATGAENRVVLLGKNSTLANLGNQTSHEDHENVACGRQPNYVQDCLAADHLTHAIGTVAFGPDGKLYVGNGDGAGYNSVDDRALRALELDSLSGKVLRLDPLTGQGLRDNPFWDGDPNSNRTKVWSYGLRNPFRFTLHPETGELYLADVGWDTWEEINAGGGKNFGWPCYEGGPQGSLQQGQYASHPTTADACQQLYERGLGAVQSPLYAYPHSGGASSASVGAFYVGTRWPEAYRNALFMADYNRNMIQYLTFNPQGEASVHDFALAVADRGGPVQVSFGPDGNLYYVTLGAVSEIRRIRFTGAGNTPPVAQLLADRTSGQAPLAVKFAGTASYDADGEGVSYTWDFGDGVNATGAEPEHVYVSNGTYTVKLTVRDAQGATGSAQTEILVGNHRPDFFFTAPRSYVTYYIGDSLGFSLTGLDPDEGDVSATAQWQVRLHSSAHSFINVQTQHGHSGELLVEDYGDNTYYEFCAVVTDSQGAASSEKCMEVRPFTVWYTFDSEPSGLQVNYAGATYTTPFTVRTIPNARREISAPALQRGYEFTEWSQGGARTQTLSVEEGARRFVARYKPSAEVPVYLSDLIPSAQSNGWGAYERDRSNGELGEHDGLPLTLNGVRYAKGLGVHADSELRYALAGRFSRFLAELGVDDEVGPQGSVIFQVFADGEQLYESALLTGDSPTVSIELEVTGRRELRLIVLKANGENSYDHADWANARLVGVP
jgi:glucose/arabinose dehydrogenase